MEDDKSLLKINGGSGFSTLWKMVESRTSRVWKSNCHCPQRWWDPPSLIFPFFSRGRQPPMPPSLQPGAYTVGKPFEMAGRSYSSKIPPKCMKNPGKQWGIHEPRWSYAHLMDGDAEFVMGSLAKEKDLQWFWNFFWKWWHFKKIILAMRDKIINIIILSCILFKKNSTERWKLRHPSDKNCWTVAPHTLQHTTSSLQWSSASRRPVVFNFGGKKGPRTKKRKDQQLDEQKFSACHMTKKLNISLDNFRKLRFFQPHSLTTKSDTPNSQAHLGHASWATALASQCITVKVLDDLGAVSWCWAEFFCKKATLFPMDWPAKIQGNIYIYGNILKSAEKKNNENDSNV